jgi:hypothetical protein
MIRWILARFLVLDMVCGMQVVAAAEENASNPLAAVSSTDLRWQYLDLTDDGLLSNRFIDFFLPSGSMRVFSPNRSLMST